MIVTLFLLSLCYLLVTLFQRFLFASYSYQVFWPLQIKHMTDIKRNNAHLT